MSIYLLLILIFLFYLIFSYCTTPIQTEWKMRNVALVFS